MQLVVIKSVYMLSLSQIGKPTDDYSNDPEGKPEGKMSKAVRGGAKMASKVTKKFAKDSGDNFQFTVCFCS